MWRKHTALYYHLKFLRLLLVGLLITKNSVAVLLIWFQICSIDWIFWKLQLIDLQVVLRIAWEEWLEGFRFKANWVLVRSLGPNIVMRLPVTCGSKSYWHSYQYMMSEIALFSAARSWFSSSQIADKKEKKWLLLSLLYQRLLRGLAGLFSQIWVPWKLQLDFGGYFKLQ